MDVYTIKKHITDNPEYIENILEASGFHGIRNISRNEYRCAFEYDSNPTSVSVNKETLASSDFGRGINGDIITLVGNKTGLNFRDTLKLICSSIGLSMDSIPKQSDIVLPFGGFFKEIGVNRDDNESLEKLDDNILDNYILMPSKMFLKDGIPIEQQIKYKIGFDIETGRVIIPQWNVKGELVGIMGRVNNEIVDEDVLKYFPLFSHKKSKTLYGYHLNYNHIQSSRVAIICESEKSVMKLDAMGIKSGLALGGSSVSPVQARNVQSAMPKNIILGLDEGLDEEIVRHQAEKLKLDNPFMNINVGYIWDEDNIIMNKGGKEAPMDKSKKEFQYLIGNCIKWL